MTQHDHAPAKFRRAASLMSVMLLVIATVVGFAGAASAATIPGAITNVTYAFSKSPPTVQETTTTTIAFHLPNNTPAGSTFTATVPTQDVYLPTTFNLDDANGNIVAVATLSGPAGNQVYTFTTTAFTATHSNIFGTAKYTSGVDSARLCTGGGNPPCNSRFTTVTNDGAAFSKTVGFVPVAGPDRTQVFKSGGFAGGNGEDCNVTATDCLGWQVQTPVGPSTGGTLTDTGVTGNTLDCPTLVRLSVTL